MEIEVILTEIKADLRYIKEKQDATSESMADHIKSSDSVRMEVHDNTRFRQNGVKAFWVGFTGLFYSIWKAHF